MQQETHTWYAVYTRSRSEKKVAEILSRKQVESYCPLNQVERQWSDRRKITAEPLFASYVFVRIPERLKSIVKEVEGVVNFVYWLGKPAVILDQEIDLIKRFLREHSHVSLEKFPIRQHDLVEHYHRGRIIEIGKNKVKAMLSSLGYAMVATIAADEVMMADDAVAQPYA